MTNMLKSIGAEYASYRIGIGVLPKSQNNEGIIVSLL